MISLATFLLVISALCVCGFIATGLGLIGKRLGLVP